MKQNDSNSVKKEVVFVLNVNFIIFLIKRARVALLVRDLARLSGIVALYHSSLFTCSHQSYKHWNYSACFYSDFGMGIGMGHKLINNLYKVRLQSVLDTSESCRLR